MHLIVTRSDAVPVLSWIVVAPVTRSVREIPTHLPLGPDEGLLDPVRRVEVCRALRAMADC